MKNVLEIDGERAVVTFDPDIGLFRGDFISLSGGADFYADSVAGLINEGRTSLAVYLDVCREKQIEPRRHYSGRFNVRLQPGLHEAASLAAAADGKSLNEWVAQTITEAASG